MKSVVPDLREWDDLANDVEIARPWIGDRATVGLGPHLPTALEDMFDAQGYQVRTLGGEEQRVPVNDGQLLDSVGLVVPPPTRPHCGIRRQLERGLDSRRHVGVLRVAMVVIATPELYREPIVGLKPGR